MGFYFCCYMLRCADDSYYVGHTDNLEKRLEQHKSGEGCFYTRSRLPASLAWSQKFSTREQAQSAEKRIKGWNRAKKSALASGRFDTISQLASRGAKGRALRDALLRKAPQGRGPSI